MPRVRRRKIRQRKPWDTSHRIFLSCGRSFFTGSEWREVSTDPDEIDASTMTDIQQAWFHFRDDLLAEFATDLVRHAGCRPWGWWVFDRQEQPPDLAESAERLDEMGLLTDAEMNVLRSRATGVLNDFHEPPFRRSWAWWRFLAPERRDKSTSEAEQLIRLVGVLTDRERFIVASGRDIDFWHARCAPQLRDLDDRERLALGLPPIERENETHETE